MTDMICFIKSKLATEVRLEIDPLDLDLTVAEAVIRIYESGDSVVEMYIWSGEDSGGAEGPIHHLILEDKNGLEEGDIYEELALIRDEWLYEHRRLLTF